MELNKNQIADHKTLFLALCRKYIKRDGLEKLIDWLEESDFFEAPASTMYHGAYAGGLCEHSLDVYRMAVNLQKGGFCDALSEESVAVAALFHDLCKVNCYSVEFRNKKIDGQWQSVPVYVFDERQAFGGHGSKSVYIAQSFMSLTLDEATAINCHMGFAGVSDTRPISAAYSQCPLAWLIHVADEAATYLLDRERES